jgi:hypothetical protein
MIEAIKHIIKDVGKLWLLFFTIFISNLFLIYSPEGQVSFIMNGFTVPKNTAIYMIYEHVGLIILAWIILNPHTSHRYMLRLYLALAIVDMFFFLLYYKSPVLWNPLRGVIFGVPLIYETWKSFRYYRRS